MVYVKPARFGNRLFLLQKLIKLADTLSAIPPLWPRTQSWRQSRIPAVFPLFRSRRTPGLLNKGLDERRRRNFSESLNLRNRSSTTFLGKSVALGRGQFGSLSLNQQRRLENVGRTCLDAVLRWAAALI